MCGLLILNQRNVTLNLTDNHFDDDTRTPSGWKGKLVHENPY